MNALAGGKGANVAAALGLAGASVRLLAAVGDDATWPLDTLKKRNVDTSDVFVTDQAPTGRAFIQVSTTDGENSIVLLRGANFVEDAPINDPARYCQDDDDTYVVLQNEIPLPVTTDFARYAAQHASVRAVFNPSPMLSADEVRAFPWDALHVLIVNEGEAADLCAAMAASDTDNSARALGALPALRKVPWLVVTRGAQGSMAGVLIDGERMWVDVPAARARQVVNTTGAGDTFTGYLIANLASTSTVTKDNVREILHRTAVAAAMAVERDGAMDSIPSKDEVEARLHEDST